MAPRLSPRGDKIAVTTRGMERHTWIFDIARDTLSRLTDHGLSTLGIWSRDGTYLAFSAVAGGATWDLFRKPANTDGPSEWLIAGDRSQEPSSWSPNGDTLSFVQDNDRNDDDIWLLSLSSRKTWPLVATNANETHPEFSPDGRWIAFASNTSGRTEVYVQELVCTLNWSATLEHAILEAPNCSDRPAARTPLGHLHGFVPSGAREGQSRAGCLVRSSCD